MSENDYIPVVESVELECPHPITKKCPVTASQQVCIQANVTIDPKVTVGDIRAFCEIPMIGKCSRLPCGHSPCDFVVSQTICVEIPLDFSVSTIVDPAGFICAPPDLKPCPKCMEDPA